MTSFVKDRQYELADYMKKHKIVNKIEPRITRAFIRVSTPYHLFYVAVRVFVDLRLLLVHCSFDSNSQSVCCLFIFIIALCRSY